MTISSAKKRLLNSSMTLATSPSRNQPRTWSGQVSDYQKLMSSGIQTKLFSYQGITRVIFHLTVAAVTAHINELIKKSSLLIYTRCVIPKSEGNVFTDCPNFECSCISIGTAIDEQADGPGFESQTWAKHWNSVCCAIVLLFHLDSNPGHMPFFFFIQAHLQDHIVWIL